MEDDDMAVETLIDAFLGNLDLNALFFEKNTDEQVSFTISVEISEGNAPSDAVVVSV
jgi:hypothetical protein